MNGLLPKDKITPQISTYDRISKFVFEKIRNVGSFIFWYMSRQPNYTRLKSIWYEMLKYDYEDYASLFENISYNI